MKDSPIATEADGLLYVVITFYNYKNFVKSNILLYKITEFVQERNDQQIHFPIPFLSLSISIT
jgi:hypothetical protein